MGDTYQLELRLHLAAARSECVVASVRGTERVSRAFRYEIEFDASDVDLDAARASELSLEIEDADGRARYVHGVLDELSVSPTEFSDRNRYLAIVVPEPSLLRHRHGFRLFQAQSVPDICRSVLARAGIAEDRIEWQLGGEYAPRELCVQYDESEWDFLSRLCEAEGIWFRFEHRADGHRMIFADDSTRAPRIDPDPLPFAFAHGDALGARAFDIDQGLASVEDRVALDDYDRLHPQRELASRASADNIVDREWYEYPGGYGDEATGRRLAQARIDELRCAHHTIVLGTTALAAIAGMRVVVSNAPVDVPDAFIVQSALAIAPEPSAAGSWRVDNTLTAIPDSQRYRPPRETPEPRISGLQTARVTGPSGQEIHIDEHGRVTLQFHWDRDAQLDEHSSPWVPVAQGHTTGAIMHPRVGWEVLVEFREGSPDRPVVVGRVYNPFFPPPHALPERKTYTTHRSDSLPGRARINEVCFEDLAHREHIAITAGHDLREVTTVQRHVTVNRHEHREVGLDRVETVGVLQKTVGRKDHSDSVGLTQTIFVGKDRTTLVRESASERVARDLIHSVGNMAYAQIGEDVPGRLQTLLQQSEHGPAQVVMAGLDPILAQLRGAASSEASHAGSAQQLLSADHPAASYVLGPVLGRLTQAPQSPPDHSGTLGRSFGDEMGKVGREIGEIAQGAAEIAEGVEKIVDGVEKLADGVDSPEEAMSAVGDLTEGLGDVNEGVTDAAGGLEGLGGVLDDANFLQGESWMRDMGNAMGDLGEVSGQVARVSEQVGEVTRSVAEASAIAEAATDMVDDPNAEAALAVLRAVSMGDRPDDPEDSDPEAHEERRDKPDNPLSWLDGLMGSDTTQTVWAVSKPIFDNLDTAIAGISGIVDAGIAIFDHGQPHPYEHNSVHFAAAAANAILRGAFARSESGQSSEGQEHSQEHGEGTWSFTVGGNDRLTVAGALVLGAADGMRNGVGGSSTQTARLARIEQIGGNRTERTDGSKTESVGRYAVVAGEGASISSDATVRCTVSGDATIAVAGAHTIEAGSQLQLEGRTVLLDGSETVVLECGSARVSISSDGIAIEGSEIVVRGNVIGVDSPALG